MSYLLQIMIKTTHIKTVRPSKSQGLNTLSVCKIKKVFKTKEHLKKMEIQEFKSKNTTPSVVASVVQSINCSLVIFFHVARKDSFSDQSLVIYSECCDPRTTRLPGENQKHRSEHFFEKKLYRSLKYCWNFHRLVYGNILYVNTLVGQSDADIRGCHSSSSPPPLLTQVS